MDKKKISLVILFVVLIVGILAVLPKTPKTPLETPTPTPTPIPEPIIKSCEPFPELPEDFSCEKAVQKALVSYPGEVQEIAMVSPPQNNPDMGVKRWIITIFLKAPFNIAGKKVTHTSVSISRENGELILTHEY